ncbi:hypothetical protein HYQ46_004027 [Verticillium longisporum]|nr:hypothetical protein HYQ46_004027 [Verticillium longisporum]
MRQIAKLAHTGACHSTALPVEAGNTGAKSVFDGDGPIHQLCHGERTGPFVFFLPGIKGRNLADEVDNPGLTTE